MNVVRQTQQAGVKNIVATSSFACLLSQTHMPAFHGVTFKETDWDDEEFEENEGDKCFICFTSKIKSELALWELVKEYPELKVATILPDYIIDPYAKTFPLPISIATMGTNDFIHELIDLGNAPFVPNWIVDLERFLAQPPSGMGGSILMRNVPLVEGRGTFEGGAAWGDG